MPDLLAGTYVLGIDTPPTKETHTGTSILDITETSWTAGASGISMTFLAPRTGRVKVTVNVRGDTDGQERVFFAPEIYEGEDATGTLVLAANRNYAAAYGIDNVASAGVFAHSSWTRLVEGLTPGATHFVRGMHETQDGAGTADIVSRTIIVEPVS